MAIVTSRRGIPAQESAFDRMKATLPWPDRERPNWLKLIAVIAARMQILEDATASLYFQSILGMAQGDRLDAYGEVMGEQRGGLTDGEFRRVIRARVRAELSRGSIESLITVVLAMSDAAEVHISEAFPHTIHVAYRARKSLSVELRGRLVKLLRIAKMGGVTLDWVAEGDSAAALFDVDAFDDSNFWEAIYDG